MRAQLASRAAPGLPQAQAEALSRRSGSGHGCGSRAPNRIYSQRRRRRELAAGRAAPCRSPTPACAGSRPTPRATRWSSPPIAACIGRTDGGQSWTLSRGQPAGAPRGAAAGARPDPRRDAVCRLLADALRRAVAPCARGQQSAEPGRSDQSRRRRSPFCCCWCIAGVLAALAGCSAAARRLPFAMRRFLEMNNALAAFAFAAARRRTVLLGRARRRARAALRRVAVWLLVGTRRKRDSSNTRCSSRATCPTAIAASPDGGVWFTIDFANAIGRVRDGKLRAVPRRRRPTASRSVSRRPPMAPPGTPTLRPARSRGSRPTGELKLGPAGYAAGPDRSDRNRARRRALVHRERAPTASRACKDGKFERHAIDPLRGAALGRCGGPATAWCGPPCRPPISSCVSRPTGACRPSTSPRAAARPADVAVAKDGAVWFLEFRGNKIGRFADGRFEEFPVGRGERRPDRARRGAGWRGVVRNAAQGQPRAPARTASSRSSACRARTRAPTAWPWIATATSGTPTSAGSWGCCRRSEMPRSVIAAVICDQRLPITDHRSRDHSAFAPSA